MFIFTLVTDHLSYNFLNNGGVCTVTENAELWPMVVSQSWFWRAQLYIQVFIWYVNYNCFISAVYVQWIPNQHLTITNTWSSMTRGWGASTSWVSTLLISQAWTTPLPCMQNMLNVNVRHRTHQNLCENVLRNLQNLLTFNGWKLICVLYCTKYTKEQLIGVSHTAAQS